MAGQAFIHNLSPFSVNSERRNLEIERGSKYLSECFKQHYVIYCNFLYSNSNHNRRLW